MLLKCYDCSITVTDTAAPIRPGWLGCERAQAAITEPTPRKRVKAAAHWLRTLYETGFDVVRILDSASDEDEETQVMLRARRTGRHATMDAIIASLDGSPRRPLPEAQAIYRAFAAPGVYQELVIKSGRTADEFEAWVADARYRRRTPRTVVRGPRRRRVLGEQRARRACRRCACVVG